MGQPGKMQNELIEAYLCKGIEEQVTLGLDSFK